MRWALAWLSMTQDMLVNRIEWSPAASLILHPPIHIKSHQFFHKSPQTTHGHRISEHTLVPSTASIITHRTLGDASPQGSPHSTSSGRTTTNRPENMKNRNRLVNKHLPRPKPLIMADLYPEDSPVKTSYKNTTYYIMEYSLRHRMFNTGSGLYQHFQKSKDAENGQVFLGMSTT